jgi:hypothetical protein
LTLAAALLFAAAWTPAFAQAVPPGGWNVNFNGDTPGLPPTLSSFKGGEVNTSPQRADQLSPDTTLVQASFGGLTDQPVVLNNDLAINDGLPSLQFGTGLNNIEVFEWDMTISSNGTTQVNNGGFFVARFFAPAGVVKNIMLFRKTDDPVEDGDIFQFGLNGVNPNVSGWLFDDPMHIKVELDRDAETVTWTVWNSLNPSGSVFANALSDPGIADIVGIEFRDAGAGVADIDVFEVGIDNFITLAPPMDVSIAQFGVADTPALQYLSRSGLTYSLESRPTPTGGNFVPAGAVQTGDGSTQNIFDPAGFDAGKTYRVVTGP